MKFDTKYKIGDMVRRKIIRTDHKTIKCPFCDGKGFVVHEGQTIECESCDNGDYDFEVKTKCWSYPYRVIGAVMDEGILMFEPKLKICVRGNFYQPNQTSMFPEDQLIMADQVNEGDPVNE